MRARLPSFWIKAGLAVAVVAVADLLLYDADNIGLSLAIVSLALAAALAVANPATRRDRLALTALIAAFLFAALQAERPTAIGWLFFALSLAVAALAPRAHAGDDGWRWFQRLVLGGLKALIGPVLDLRDVLKVRARSRPLKVTAVLLAAVLPICGGAVFLWLFAAANPVIEGALASLSLPESDVARLVFWVVVALPGWAVLRPRGLRRTFAAPGLDGDLDIPGVTTASIVLSLLVFNALFAIQNGLDIAFLWSGAGLPKGVTFADYAHRGAYPLIATALLAGLFVLVFLRPGSATAALRPVRILVVAWIVQNLFLVASTALRTWDYIEAYSLTRMRIAALLWMALVAVGLVLIVWRLIRGRSSSWLINANLAAAGVVLVLCSVVDLGALAAAWNVRHAREVGGKGVNLDLCYMRSLKGAAVVSLAEMERRPMPPTLRERVMWTRQTMTADMAEAQSDWRFWCLRDARRLDRVATLTGSQGHFHALDRRGCDAVPRKPPGPLVVPRATQPLTPTPNPGT